MILFRSDMSLSAYNADIFFFCIAPFIFSCIYRTCTDIDECSEYRGRGRLCIGICVNTPGTFKCSCPDGYQLASDGHTCKG